MNMKKKVIISVMSLILVITGVFIGVFLQYSYKSIDSHIKLRIESVQAIIKSFDENNRKKYSSRIKSFVKYNTSPNRDAIFKAFENLNREKLLERSIRFFNLFKKEDTYFSTMAWLTPDNHCFLRVHNSKKYGDDISSFRTDIVIANQTQKQYDGYIVAGTGLLYSVIQPVLYKNKHLGVIQFGIRVAFLLDTIYKDFKSPVGLLMSNDKYKFVTRPSIPVISDKFFTIQSKNLTFFQKISDQIDWTLTHQTVYLKGKTYILLNVLPLLNYKKQIQGSIITVLDISQQLSEIKSRTILIIVLSLILLISSFLILNFSFSFLLKKITNLNNSLEKNNKELLGRSNELQQERDRLEFVIDGANLGTWDWNIQTGEVVFNERWAEILGYKLSEINPHVSSWENIIHPDESKKTIRALKDHLEEKVLVYRAEHRLLHKSGNWVWVLGVGKVFKRDKDGKPLRAVGIQLDISNQKEKEEKRLEASRQVEQKKRFESLTTMAGAIAHRFNNAMAVVHGNLELITLSFPDNSDIIKKVTAALTAANGASQIGSMMLYYIGQHPLKRQKLFFSDLVKECLEELRFFKTSFTVEFTPPDKPIYVSADKLQIKDVIKNILTNAEESFESASGTIKIVFGTASYTSDSFPIPFQESSVKNAMYSFCEIKDSGHGIMPENILRIFEPFYTTNFVGRGLGLALSVGIMQAHNGAIIIKSKPDRGTIVRVLLPVTEFSGQVLPDTNVESKNKQFTGNILLVDDERMVIDIGKQRLERLGFTVYTAVNGLEAVSSIRKQDIHFCAIIMDVSMPKMDGVEAMKAIRKINSDIPIILCSGYSEDKFEFNKNSDIKPDLFLMKPFLINELRNSLDKLLSP